MNQASVVFSLRKDARDKPGGDTKKVDHYRRELANLGINTDLVYDAQGVINSRAPVCHMVNLDLPIENRYVAKAAKGAGKRVVLSTVAHPIAGLEAMYELGDDRSFRLLKSLAVPSRYGLLLREHTKLIRRHRLPALSMPRGYLSAQQRLLDLVDLVLPMADSEGVYLAGAFSLGTSQLKVVPNGSSFADRAVADAPDRDIDVIAVGRVEPRKQSLEMARCLAHSDLRSVFVGGLNGQHRAYTTQFLDIVNKSPNIEWIGAVPPTGVRLWLSRSRVYVNPAWCEVVSQADIEAASVGCAVVTTRHSYIQDFLGAGLLLLDPAHVSDGSLLELLIMCCRENSGPPLIKQASSWAEVSTALVRAYEGLSDAMIK